VTRQRKGGIDKAQIEHVLPGGSSALTHSDPKVVIVDDGEMQASPPQQGATPQGRVHPAPRLKLRYFACLRFENDVLRRLQSVVPIRYVTATMKASAALSGAELVHVITQSDRRCVLFSPIMYVMHLTSSPTADTCV
jgi:hypothetical protein